MRHFFLFSTVNLALSCLKSTTRKPEVLRGQGLLITGGFGAVRGVEIVDISNSRKCRLDDLPDPRWWHTQNGELLCGGFGTPDTCLTWTDGSWSVSHNLIHGRAYHTSWVTQDGVLLVGGGGSGNTTEIATWRGTSEKRFNLKHTSIGSCLIDEGQTFILTGGQDSEETVSRYNINGWLEDLDNLNTGRWQHGCTQYTNNDGVKTNLVCGGWDGTINYLTSCEMNIATTRSWSYTTSLPRPLSSLRGVTLDNRVLMTGGYDDGDNERDEILELVDGDWRAVATMQTAGYAHAVTVINDYWQYCK